jgi:hypothetical protein
MEAIIDVAATANVEMATRMLIAVRVIIRVEKVLSIKARHRSLF